MNVAGRKSGAGPSGARSPIATGTSDRPAASTTPSTASAAITKETLPHPTVSDRTSSVGSVSAHHSATASSTPPSVSTTTGRALTPRCYASRLSAATTGPSHDHGKLIHFSVWAHTYSGRMID